MKQMNLKKLMKITDSKSTKYKKVKDGRDRVGIHSSLKENYDNRIIFVREGMYVYAYGEDAKIVSEVVGIPIENGEVAIHYEDVTECLKKLINAGYKAGIENDWSFHDADLEEYYKQKKSVSDSRKIQDYSYSRAQRYNKRHDEIFASYEKYLRKEMEWLRRQGVSEDEIQNAYKNTGLHGSGLQKLIQQVAVENGDNRELSEILGEAHSIADSRKVKDGYSNNPNYFGDWYGKGQIDFNAIINPEDEGDIYMVKIWCGSGYVLDVYLCKAFDEQDAIDKVFEWSYENEGENNLIFDYNYLCGECKEDYMREYGLNPEDVGNDYSSSMDYLSEEILRLMDKADEDTMNGNLSNGFVILDRNGNETDEAIALFDEYLIDWTLSEIDTQKKDGHYPVGIYLLSEKNSGGNALLLKVRVTQYGSNVIECKMVGDEDLREYGIDYESYETIWFESFVQNSDYSLFSYEENFFVGKVPEDVLAENGYGEVSDSRRVSDSDYDENSKLGLEIRQWTQSKSPSYADVTDRLKSYGYSYVFKISKGKKVYEFWKLNNSDYGVTMICAGDSLINAVREDYDSFLQGA